VLVKMVVEERDKNEELRHGKKIKKRN